MMLCIKVPPPCVQSPLPPFKFVLHVKQLILYFSTFDVYHLVKDLVPLLILPIILEYGKSTLNTFIQKGQLNISNTF